MSSYIARQPIFNRKLNIFGYELLYRTNASSTDFDGSDGDKASSETIMNSFHELGIERVTGGKRAFVNFTERLLLDKVATILSNKILVIELLETIKPTDEVLGACKSLKKQGYMLALDDFIIQPEFFPLLQIADIVKVDFMAEPLDKIRLFAGSMKNKNIRLLAERIETYDMFETAKDMGFSLFQGHFFSKPVTVKTETKLNPLKINCMQLIRMAMKPNVNFREIASIIMRDVALSYRLLRVVNSAFFGLRYTVKNIRQALAILGMNEVKKWVTLISLAEIKDDKPDELIRISLIRARFLETIGPQVGMSKHAEDLFMLGLMSLMDALMDQPMADIIEQTHISPTIAEALITQEGKHGDLLRMVTHYENSEWVQALEIADAYRLSADDLFETYVAAIEWSNSLQ